jgi:hypothetical protein
MESRVEKTKAEQSRKDKEKEKQFEVNAPSKPESPTNTPQKSTIR